MMGLEGEHKKHKKLGQPVNEKISTSDNKINVVAKNAFFFMQLFIQKPESDQQQLLEAFKKDHDISKVHTDCFNVQDKGAGRHYLDNDLDTEKKSEKEGKQHTELKCKH